VLDEWRLDYNHRRPHSSLGWQAPAVYAASLEDNDADGVFPAAMHAAPAVGAPPLPPDQHADTLNSILSL